jgi:hypothetical protein
MNNQQNGQAQHQPGPNQSGQGQQDGGQAVISQVSIAARLSLQRPLDNSTQLSKEAQMAFIKQYVDSQKAKLASHNAAGNPVGSVAFPNRINDANPSFPQNPNPDAGPVLQNSPRHPQQNTPNMQNLMPPNNTAGTGNQHVPQQNARSAVPVGPISNEMMSMLLANVRQSPSTMASLTNMINTQGTAAFPANQREALLRFANNQGRMVPGQPTQASSQTQAQMMAAQARLIHAGQQVPGNGGSPVQAQTQPGQNRTPTGPRQNQPGAHSQPLQVQAQGQTPNLNPGQANGGQAGGRAPPPGPIAMPLQAGQIRGVENGVNVPGQASNPGNVASRPNMSKQALDQQLQNIFSNLDVFIRKKENNELDAEQTRMVSGSCILSHAKHTAD